MRPDWDYRSLGSVAHIEMGQSPPSAIVSDEQNSGVAFLQGNGEFTDRYPIPRLWCRRPPKMSAKGDTLLSVRAPVGALNVADRAYCIGRGLAAIRFRLLSPDFGRHALTYQSKLLRVVAQGTTFEAIGGPDLRALPIPVPAQEEQRRIAEILDTLDEAIRGTEAVIAKLHEVKRGLLHDLLTRGVDENGELRDPEAHPEQFKRSPLGLIPREWTTERFGSCLHGTPQNGLYKPATYYSDAGTPIVRIDGIYDGILAPVESLKRLRINRQEAKTYGLLSGDILINRVNSIDYVGKAAHTPDLSENVVFESNVMRCQVRSNILRSDFAALWLTAPTARRWFRRRAKSAIAQASINQSDVGALWVPVPPMLEQGRCLDAVESLNGKIATEAHSLDKLRTLKNGLMEDLLTGRVRAPVSAEAPSSSTGNQG